MSISRSPDRSRARALLATAIFVVLGLVLARYVLSGAADPQLEDVPQISKIRLEDQLARERASALFAEDSFERAREAMAPLLEGPSPASEDLIRATAIELALADIERGRPLAERALAAAPDSASANWNWYRVLSMDGEFEAALPFVQRAYELAPDDFPTRLSLAALLDELDRPEEAAEHFEALLEVPVEYSGSWRLIALYRYWRVLILNGDPRADAIRAEEIELDKRLTRPSSSQIERGNLGLLEPPPVLPPRIPQPQASAEIATESTGKAFGGPGWKGVRIAVLREPVITEEEQRAAYLYQLPFVEPALIAWGESGVALLAEDAPAVEVLSGATRALDAFDLGEGAEGDGDLDLVVAQNGTLRFVENTEAGWIAWEDPLFHAGDAEPINDVAVVDFDHDGDVDLLVVGGFGVRLMRNDGAGAEGGGFTDATPDSGLPDGGDYDWCLIEDFDTDQDVDFLFGGRGGVFLASNERNGVFSDASALLPEAFASGAEPVVADFNGDGLPDIVLPTDPPIVLRATAKGTYETTAGGADSQEWPGGAAAVRVADWDLDGALDVVCAADDAEARIQLAPGFHAVQQVLRTESASDLKPATGVDVGDLNGDAVPDLVRVEPAGLRVYHGAGNRRGLALNLRGLKDNDRGVGAVVEVRSGAAYTRVYATGSSILLGLGERESADVLRVTWPNAVVQHFIDAPATNPWRLLQREGLIGSCPFLYAWNGEAYTFISDVIGITPLGLPMAPGQLVPPDHDEYVLVRGDQLVPKDGFFELQFTEELREVTYLDRIRLDVIDHPEGTEVYPNERFSFPPFPEPHTHVLREPLVPLRATDQAGLDWTDAVSANDGVMAEPFEPLAGQFLGLATPYWLEFEFDADDVKNAEQLRLFLSGWFYWTDASVNMASARHPSIAFVPPILQVPDGNGGWRDAGPPLGFPAGKLKTMVIDVSAMINREDPRIRLFSTLELYWDSVRLGTNLDENVVTTPIEPASANLWERGFSASVPFERYENLDWFDWDQVAGEPRWNQHPGAYTRYGDVLPLLGGIDDQFVIMGAGDTLTVRFAAAEAPPLQPGWVRDYFVFLDGWAKDRDPNTHEALQVEPLPFHGMSGYPYGPDEEYPNDEVHRRYRYEWNTRPGRQLIRPLADRAPTRGAVAETNRSHGTW